MEAAAFLGSEEYQRRFAEADLVIAHAGMGTILGAIEAAKPLIIVPRRASLGEHRNEHQLGTAKRFRNVPGIRVVDDVSEIGDALDDLLGGLEANRLVVPAPLALAARVQHELEQVAPNRRPRLLAIASGGGHWVQLCRVIRVLDGVDVQCATTELGDESLTPNAVVFRVRDGNRWSKAGLLRSALDTFRLVARLRPDAVLTTGAAPGYFALMIARMLRIRTIWLDSIANVDEMSLCGRKAKGVADVWLTQWPELASANGPEYVGSVLPVFEHGMDSLIDGTLLIRNQTTTHARGR
jgi:UDP-N-acetylglucosamine transferase subunit ALG13